ncbi:expressed unknown protein [Seminavis robusta]|uniref:Uncharacterized protein n=1 Tax=Seminavis robusta TaxID=568900 RepID=A0A9N8HFC8_9STRA|nr:expressed unknown protein [Seminavis robusta]|eukprot:Sro429_g141070.1 n/a (369) ;mRNA; f:30136-31242
MENNENLQVQVAQSEVGWRAFLGFCAQQEQARIREDSMNAANKVRANPLSPKNHRRLPSPRGSKAGGKRASFDDETLLQKANQNKRAKMSHESAQSMSSASLHAGMRCEDTLNHVGAGASMMSPALMAHYGNPLQAQQAAAASSLFLNPALFAAANAAAAHQLILAQALAASGSTPTTVQQQLNSIISSEINRLATTGGSSDHGGLARPSYPSMLDAKLPPSALPGNAMMQHDATIACLNLGEEFLPMLPGCKLCDCGMALCHEIGYPNRCSVPFPDNDEGLLTEWCQTLDIADPRRLREIRLNPSKFRLAYWHFRKRGDQKRLLPDQSLQGFVDEVQDTMGRRKPSKRMLELHSYWCRVRRPPTLDP